MSLRRLPRKMLVLLLVPAAVVVGSSFGGSVAAGASGVPAASARHGQANPEKVAPILAPATPSELAVIRQVEARESDASAYDPPASATYSLAVLNGYANPAK